MAEVALEGGTADANDLGDGSHGVLSAGVHLSGNGELVLRLTASTRAMSQNRRSRHAYGPLCGVALPKLVSQSLRERLRYQLSEP